MERRRSSSSSSNSSNKNVNGNRIPGTPAAHGFCSLSCQRSTRNADDDDDDNDVNVGNRAASDKPAKQASSSSSSDGSSSQRATGIASDNHNDNVTPIPINGDGRRVVVVGHRDLALQAKPEADGTEPEHTAWTSKHKRMLDSVSISNDDDVAHGQVPLRQGQGKGGAVGRGLYWVEENAAAGNERNNVWLGLGIGIGLVVVVIASACTIKWGQQQLASDEAYFTFGFVFNLTFLYIYIYIFWSAKQS
ncbi:uncharacterized protein [Drosophila virilis]|uniref:Uncharacterized protein n=1 Tax=Drosophila virilis TaxID=7244 RepID=A0A0Q9VY64_DROVI|nr:uncharacterized protein Dvir_GJ25894 [Drosophila virilis]